MRDAEEPDDLDPAEALDRERRDWERTYQSEMRECLGCQGWFPGYALTAGRCASCHTPAL